MIRIEEAHVFPISREVGFDFITDIHNWPRYWPGFVRLRDPSLARWANPGDRVQIDLRLLGRVVTLNLELAEFRRPKAVIYRTTQRGLPDARHERHFDEVPEGFLYRLVVESEPRKGLPGLFDRTLVRQAIRRAVRRTIRNLTEVLRSPGN